MTRALIATALIALPALCAAQERPADVTLEPKGSTEELQETLQEALILAQPGAVIELAAGTYSLHLGLSLSVDRVILRGQGADKTILDFTGQEAGSEGLLVTGHGVTLQGFAVRGTKGDAIKVKGAKGITFRSVRAEWLGKPSAKNGGYGLYPVQCQDVLIEDCSARGASDAGIYVGQSRRVIVRRCTVEENVAGIEIENSRIVDVYGNTATKNTGGILVFDLPNLPVKDGGHVRVFENTVRKNETPNFAPEGNIVASVPRGTGMLIMANRGVEIFKNTIADHSTTNVLVVSYLSTGIPLKDEAYDPFPDAVYLHGNTFGPCGQKPDGKLGAVASQAIGLPLPDVLWDGAHPGQGSPPEKRVVIGEHETVSFGRLDLLRLLKAPETAKPSREIAPHRGELPRLAPVTLGGAK